LPVGLTAKSDLFEQEDVKIPRFFIKYLVKK
jgi:hypothetical protein